jgi:Recombinational DNA repair ATPase (RecF pathway)
LVLNSLGRREITVRFHPDEGSKKTILLDRKKISRFSDMMGCLRCVIFSPEDLGLIKDGPSVRRRYLDMMISQVNRGYFIALQQYKSAMDQRNAFIRLMRTNGGTDLSVLSAFEETMAGPAAVILRERRKLPRCFRKPRVKPIPAFRTRTSSFRFPTIPPYAKKTKRRKLFAVCSGKTGRMISGWDSPASVRIGTI